MTADDQQDLKPDEAPIAKKEDVKLPDPPSDEALEKAERLLQESSLARIRGQNVAAERLLSEATELAPGSALVQAAIGDDFLARKQYGQARRAFYLAHKLEPEDTAYETKYAESILGGGAMSSLGIENSMSEQYASAKTAVILSILFCGLGQVVCGKRSQGFTFMGIWLSGVAWLSLAVDGFGRLLGLAGIGNTPGDSLMLVPFGMIAVPWILSIAMAGNEAKGSAKKTVDRPLPPGDGDFEI